MNRLVAWYYRSRIKQARKRRQRRERRLLPLYFNAYDQRKCELDQLIISGASEELVKAKLYEIRSAIVEPLVKMGYLSKNAYVLSPRRYASEFRQIDKIIARTRAGLNLPGP